MELKDLNNEDTIQLGFRLIEILKLKVKRNGRINTQWGSKTPMGLALTVKRIMQEAQDRTKEH